MFKTTYGHLLACILVLSGHVNVFKDGAVLSLNGVDILS